MKAQRRMFTIAYRILGSASEAEDLVQDVWLRWQKAERSEIANAPAFLAVVATRLAINRARASCTRREAYDLSSYSELVDVSAGPSTTAERGEELARAIAILLERLSARERAAYVLREAFNYSYLHIASLLNISEVSSRQLVTRARKHIAHARGTPVSSSKLRAFCTAFARAAQRGEVAALEGLFATDALAS